MIHSYHSFVILKNYKLTLITSSLVILLLYVPVLSKYQTTSNSIKHINTAMMCTSTAETLKGRNKVNKVENKVGVSFEGLTYSVKVKNTGKKNVDDEKSPSTLTILNDLNGSFEPEKLTMIMGPSGSGKSTLLDTLAGRKNSGILEGKIFFNGNPPTQDDYRFTVGYVEQFDTLVGELTVEQM